VVGSAQASSPAGSQTFRLVGRKRPAALDGALFYAALPGLVADELRRFRPDVVLTQSVYEAAAVFLGRRLARSAARVVVDVHGDWDTATALYGSRRRRLLAPLTTRVSRSAIRRADGVRTISEFTSRRVRREGVEPASVFPAFVDVDVFLDRAPAPLPDAPRVLFVGVLERYKNVDGLAAAWSLVSERAPGARLLVIGDGRERTTVERLVAAHAGGVEWRPVVPQEEVARALDSSTLLLLPSRSEGLPRIVIEAFCRGRPVVGARSGGIPDIVEDGVNGLLVPSGDTEALAGAVVRLLTDGPLVCTLADGARASADAWLQTPEQYAENIRRLVERVARA
jgi:glycosyltransferase involved in cell wall biosynthesis